MREKESLELFVTCAQSLEPLLVEELIRLGYSEVTSGFRGASVQANDLEAVYKINYLSRIASRVLMPIARFRCYDSKALYVGAFSLDWSAYFTERTTFAIDANVTHQRLRNSLFAAQVIKDAICDQLRQKKGWRPSVNIKDPDIQLNLYIQNDWAILSFDTSGQPLHKRGYRQEGVEAPMQETLAAALLSLAKFQGTEVVCDPCCGSGTLLIEAALMASHTPPGFLRTRWGFMHLPNYVQEDWLQVKVEADRQRRELPQNHFWGMDISKQSVHAAKVNLRAAGLHRYIEIVQGDVRQSNSATSLADPSFVITNPPYGRRLDDVEHLRGLYRSIGDFMKRRTIKPARGFVFTGSLELAKEVGLAPARRHVCNNGGVESRLLEFDLY